MSNAAIQDASAAAAETSRVAVINLPVDPAAFCDLEKVFNGNGDRLPLRSGCLLSRRSPSSNV